MYLDNCFAIQWYDRQGIISTRPVDVHTTDGLRLYLAFLFILQRFEAADWGMHPAFPPFPGPDDPISISSDTILPGTNPSNPIANRFFVIGDKRFRLESTIRHKQWGIKGRSTSVVDCVEVDQDGQTKRLCVVKLGFPEESRRREHEFIDHARAIAANKPSICDNIPDHLAYEDYIETSSSHIRKFLDLDTSGSRRMYAIVLVRLDGTIRQLTGKDYWDVWWNCFDSESFMKSIDVR